MADREQFYSHFTKTLFIHAEDALDLGKIRFFAGKYRRGDGMQQGVYAFLDVDDARPVLMDLSWNKPVNLVDYKGGTNGGGEIVSRALSIKTDKDKPDTLWFEIKNGPGKKSETGAVMPSGDATASVAIPFKVEEARRMALAILAYISAHETARVVVEMMEGGLTPRQLARMKKEFSEWEHELEEMQNKESDPENHDQPEVNQESGDLGMSPSFLVQSEIVKDPGAGRRMMDMLGMQDGYPTDLGMKTINLFLKWRKVPGYSEQSMESARKAASRAILGEVPPDN